MASNVPGGRKPFAARKAAVRLPVGRVSCPFPRRHHHQSPASPKGKTPTSTPHPHPHLCARLQRPAQQHEGQQHDGLLQEGRVGAQRGAGGAHQAQRAWGVGGFGGGAWG